MNFAPVVVPTLCRYEHFRQCLNSLSECTYATQTDVYIGLDYPLKKEHWDGYNKIVKFLHNFDKKKFKNLIIIRRPYNFGVGKNGNDSLLIQEIIEKYGCVIFTEDDNIFSPNFLDYMNQGLKIYKDQKDILAICGYRHYYPIKYESNTIYRQNVDFSAWGYGIWKDRYDKLSNCNYKYFRKKIFSPIIWKKLFKNGNYRLSCFLSYTVPQWDNYITDNVYSVFAAINDMNLIMPSKVSLVRNIGIDGSGVNFNNADNTLQKELAEKHSTQDIDTEKAFQFIGTGYEFYNENKLIHRNCSYTQISNYKTILLVLKYFIKQILKFSLPQTINKKF